MKPIMLAGTLLLAGSLTACGGHGPIQDLPLVWTGAKNPAATTAVEKALAAGPVEVGEFKDARAVERDVVGVFEDDGFRVRTKGDVRAFWAGRLRIMVESAGLKFGAPGASRFDAELLEFHCVEGNTFDATVRMKVTVTRRDGVDGRAWSKVYEGKGKRWGRTHNPENFSEALTSALAEAGRKLVQDPEFAAALTGQPARAASK
jgi:hypothetical protein